MAAEGAILNEMLEIVAKRAALRTFDGDGASRVSAVVDNGGDRGSEYSSGGRRRPFESEVSGWLVVALLVAAVFACLSWYVIWASSLADRL